HFFGLNRRRSRLIRASLGSGFGTKKRRASNSPGARPFPSLDLDLNRLRLLRLGLRNVDTQHPVLGFGADPLRIGVVGKHEAARERTVEILLANCVLVLALLLVLALAAQCVDAVLHGDLDVFLLDLEKLGLDQVLLVGLTDVGGGRPLDVLASIAAQAAIEERRKAAEEVFHLSKGLPASEKTRLPSRQIRNVPPLQ